MNIEASFSQLLDQAMEDPAWELIESPPSTLADTKTNTRRIHLGSGIAEFYSLKPTDGPDYLLGIELVYKISMTPSQKEKSLRMFHQKINERNDRKSQEEKQKLIDYLNLGRED